jgi:hypothetical protein
LDSSIKTAEGASILGTVSVSAFTGKVPRFSRIYISAVNIRQCLEKSVILI